MAWPKQDPYTYMESVYHFEDKIAKSIMPYNSHNHGIDQNNATQLS
jgi:hypothetical protein